MIEKLAQVIGNEPFKRCAFLLVKWIDSQSQWMLRLNTVHVIKTESIGYGNLSKEIREKCYYSYPYNTSSSSATIARQLTHNTNWR